MDTYYYSTQLAADTEGFGGLINPFPVLANTSVIQEEARIYSDKQIKEFDKLDKITPEVKKALAKLK
ncbi:unnamed protein product [marine sediment metagenome]|uniref:Uncharacterized protein n=1 Tax=marine sediment metagenome TaxID=412755 RepID=X0S9H5_9ZZZZ